VSKSKGQADALIPKHKKLLVVTMLPAAIALQLLQFFN
jgi:hypothetical protein